MIIWAFFILCVDIRYPPVDNCPIPPELSAPRLTAADNPPGSYPPYSMLLHVRLRAQFQRASDRLGDNSRVSISSTGALAACFSLSHSLTPVTDAPSRCSYLPGGSSPHRDDHASALSLKAILMMSFRRRYFGLGCVGTRELSCALQNQASP